MVQDNQNAEKYIDPIAQFIIDFLDNKKSASSVTPEEIAKAFYQQRQRPNDKPNAWQKYLNSVKQHAKSLARSGQIALIRRGEVVDPNNFKGVVRLQTINK